jgi:hypothetical protein
MPRLYRPHIPLRVRCRVAMRQLGEFWPEVALTANAGGLQAFLDRLLYKLTWLLAGTDGTLHLDHNPALALRKRRGEGKGTVYDPHANDPDYLEYRTAHTHHIKTQVRGDGAQYPDRVLIKRERRRKRKLKAKRRHKWPSRKLRSRQR